MVLQVLVVDEDHEGRVSHVCCGRLGYSNQCRSTLQQKDGAGFPGIAGVSKVRNILGEYPTMVQLYLNLNPDNHSDRNLHVDISHLTSYYAPCITDRASR